MVNAPFNKDMRQGAAQGFRDRWAVGTGWYRRTLNITEKRDGYDYLLDFGGVFEDSTVWVNGTEAGGRKYGYSPFRVDITDYINGGDNLIEVRVNNTEFPADRWYGGGGIYRTVRLIEAEKIRLDEAEVIITPSTDGRVVIRTGASGSVTAAVYRNGAPCSPEVFGTGTLELTVPDPKPWSAEEPNLYTVTLKLSDGAQVTDEISVKFGFRDVSFIPKKGLYVNDKPVKLKGVCLHQDVGCRGIAAKRELWRERLLELKGMGCNCVRPSHHVFSSEFLDLCDELGFYVYEEAFDKWVSGSYARYFEDNWRADIAAMVKRDRNRPSVIIWGTGNEVENQGHDSMVAILRMIYDYIKELDATRPVTYAMNPHFKREAGIDAAKVADIQQFVDVADVNSITVMEEQMWRIKRIADIVDIIACNYQEQWYDEIHRYNPDKLILGTEVYQYFKGHYDQLQNYTDENPNLVPFERGYVIGGIVWTGYDYLGESMGYPAKGWSGAPLRTNGERRFSYHLLKSYWSEEPTVRFGVLDYSLEDEGVKEHWDIPPYAEHWHFPQFQKTVIPYAIASNCDEVALYHNDKRHFIPKPADCPNRIITGFLPYIPGTVTVVGLRGGAEVCRHTLTTPSHAVRLRFDEPEREIIADGEYELLLTVRAVDENGNPCFRESQLVRFRIEGGGEIIAVDNGRLKGSEPYNNEAIHMFNGCASVLVLLRGDTGRVSVYADAAGLFTAAANIINKK
jgi:beta-galactosidase